MDVLTLLKNDHKAVASLLEQAKHFEPGDKRLVKLAEQIETALTVHAAIEEKYFYPRLRDRSEESEDVVDVFEAYTEHELIKKLIALLKSAGHPAEQFKAELQVLTESVRHHVKEEEKTIFTLARHTLDADELEELGEAMEEAKTHLLGRSTARQARRRTAVKKPAKKKSPRRTTRR